MSKIIAAGLIALAVFTALAHGGVEPWSQFLFVCGVGVLTALWLIHAARQRKLALYLPATTWPLLGLVLLGLVQSVTWQDADGYRQSLSWDVETTRNTALWLACLLLCSLLAANFLAHRERLEKLAQFLTLFGVLLATFAVIQYFTWNDRFFWLRPTSVAGAPFGPFVNRNHFAGYMELLLPWPIALLLTRHRNSAEKVFYGFAAFWIAAVAIFSQSRGGLISIVTQLIFLAAFAPGLKNHDRAPRGNNMLPAFALRAGAVLAILLVTALGVFWLGAERVVNRLANAPELAAATTTVPLFQGGRGELWRHSWDIFRANPLTGVGLGAFETALPKYLQMPNPGVVVSQTHNDYLQILTDGGLIGALLAVWFLFVTVRGISVGLRVREPFMQTVVLACGAGICGLLVHSLFDFNLQLLSHALLFLSFASLAVQLSELAKAWNLAPVRHTAPGFVTSFSGAE